MSKIQINNLQAAGSELFNGNESFLTELQATEASAIFGGKKNTKKNTKKDKYAVDAAPAPVQPVPVFIPVPVCYVPVVPPCGCHA